MGHQPTRSCPVSAQTAQGNLDSLFKVVNACVWPPRTHPRLHITSSLENLAFLTLPNSYLPWLSPCLHCDIPRPVFVSSQLCLPPLCMHAFWALYFLAPTSCQQSVCQPFPLSILVGPPLTTTILFSPTQTAQYLGLTWRSIPPWSLCV